MAEINQESACDDGKLIKDIDKDIIITNCP